MHVREINNIIWHCSASPEGRPDTAEAIREWHISKGWSDIGYHFIIELDGEVKVGRPVDVVGAHVRGHNDDSIGICYIGGMTKDGKSPKDTRTNAQRIALYAITREMLELFPGATVSGHNQYDNKACPSFNAEADWAAYISNDKKCPTCGK